MNEKCMIAGRRTVDEETELLHVAEDISLELPPTK